MVQKTTILIAQKELNHGAIEWFQKELPLSKKLVNIVKVTGERQSEDTWERLAYKRAKQFLVSEQHLEEFELLRETIDGDHTVGQVQTLFIGYQSEDGEINIPWKGYINKI